MQILKSKKEQKEEFNQFVPHNPSYTEISLDKIANVKKAARRTLNTFLEDQKDKKDKGLPTATDEYNALLDNKVLAFVRKFPPPFARPEYAHFTVIDENTIKWDVDALNIFIRTGTSYSNPFEKLERVVKLNLLKHYKVDTSLLDGITLNKEVDFYCNKFKEDYLKQLEEAENNIKD